MALLLGKGMEGISDSDVLGSGAREDGFVVW